MSFDDLIQKSNEYGWLANFIGIFTPVSALIYSAYKWILPEIKKIDIFSTINISSIPGWTVAKSKKYATVAIVDDQPQDFPIKELQAAGFNITLYKQVQLSHVNELSRYDMVFLDMKGVVKDDPEYGGLKLISELRDKNPYQKICAVSSKTFDPTATDFFKKADKTKRKPLTAQECSSVIENFSDDLFNPSKIINEITPLIQLMSRKNKKYLHKAINNFMAGGDEVSFRANIDATDIPDSVVDGVVNFLRGVRYAN